MNRRMLVGFVLGIVATVATAFVSFLVYDEATYNKQTYGTYTVPRENPYDFQRDENGKILEDGNGNWVYNDGSVHEVHRGQHQNCDICAQQLVDRATEEARQEDERYQRSLQEGPPYNPSRD
ncbi:MAG TPA: hypothetical protein VJJ24_03455 [Candidatus Paceibacterota bacterium]